MGVRKIPHGGERVETGAVQFGGDWPGLFVRGDEAIQLLGWLQIARDHSNVFDQYQIDELMRLIDEEVNQSSVKFLKPDE